MAERSGALEGHYRPGVFGSPGRSRVTLQLIVDTRIHQLSAWPETIDAIESLAQFSVGTQGRMPGYGESVVGTQGVVVRTEPLAWWLLDSSVPVVDANVGTTLDLSHSRTRLVVAGEESHALINRFMPVDLRDSACPVGRVLSTSMHHTSVTLWRSASGLELFLPRGFALSLFALLCEGAEQFGYEILPTTRSMP